MSVGTALALGVQAQEQEKQVKGHQKWHPDRWLFVLLSSACASYLTFDESEVRTSYIFFHGFQMLLIIAFLAAITLSEGLISKVLAQWWVQWLGESSWDIYVLHLPAAGLTQWLLSIPDEVYWEEPLIRFGMLVLVLIEVYVLRKTYDGAVCFWYSLLEAYVRQVQPSFLI